MNYLKNNSNFFIIKAFVLTSLTLLTSCSTPDIAGYTSEPYEKPVKVQVESLNFEVKLIDQSEHALSGVKITLKTRNSEDHGVTNSEGLTNLATYRTANEPLTFIFEGKGLNATEIIGHLPSSLIEGGMVFETHKSNRVRLSHYKVDGLYR